MLPRFSQCILTPRKTMDWIHLDTSGWITVYKLPCQYYVPTQLQVVAYHMYGPG
jgi:hypothetical protein